MILSGNFTSSQPPAGQAWLALEQEPVKGNQNFATNKDLRNMLIAVRTGSAFGGIVTCNVQRKRNNDGVTVTYVAAVLVHTSLGLKYNLAATSGDENLKMTGPRPLQQQKSESIFFSREQTKPLNWQPKNFTAIWDGPVYGPDNQIISPTIKQDNGFIYLSTVAYGSLRVRGLAQLDRWQVTIEHAQGSEWVSSVQVTATWGDQSLTIKLELPQCVLDKFNECSPVDYSGGFDLTGSWANPWEDYGQYQLNPAATVYYSVCTLEVLWES